MSRRGVYRGLYSSLVDDPDFQALSPHARLTLLVVRICSQAGAAAIFRYYPELLRAQTGLSPRSLESAFIMLERPQPSGGRPWIEREGVVLWVRNGLRHDPFTSIANPKHRSSVETALQSLPHLRIVLRFCDYYSLTYPFATHALGGLDSMRLTPSDTDTDTEEDRYRVSDEPPVSRQPEPDKATAGSSPTLTIPASVTKALDQARTLGKVRILRTLTFWQANILATNGSIEYGQEILKAEAWLTANPSRSPRKDLARFLHNWIARAGERT